MTKLHAIEFRILNPEWSQQLGQFFGSLREAGDDKYFHPHPLTPEEAKKRCNYIGKDLYYICVEGNKILGYGMLRGWDEGYSIPSLGIAIHSSARGIGIGKAFVYFLHTAARRRGAKKIRLKVYSENSAALKLYEKVGYKFKSREGKQHVGFFNLD